VADCIRGQVSTHVAERTPEYAFGDRRVGDKPDLVLGNGITRAGDRGVGLAPGLAYSSQVDQLVRSLRADGVRAREREQQAGIAPKQAGAGRRCAHVAPKGRGGAEADKGAKEPAAATAGARVEWIVAGREAIGQEGRDSLYRCISLARGQ